MFRIKNAQKSVNIEDDYSCSICAYTTVRYSDYKRHCMTPRHKYRTNMSDIEHKRSNDSNYETKIWRKL